MNWRELARQSGATNPEGRPCATTFCFTEQELQEFTEKVILECQRTVQIEATLPRTADTTTTTDLQRVAALQAVFSRLENLMEKQV